MCLSRKTEQRLILEDILKDVFPYKKIDRDYKISYKPIQDAPFGKVAFFINDTNNNHLFVHTDYFGNYNIVLCVEFLIPLTSAEANAINYIKVVP